MPVFATTGPLLLRPSRQEWPQVVRIVCGMAAVLSLFWLLLVTLLWVDETGLVFMAGGTHWQTDRLDAAGFRRVWITTADHLRIEGVTLSPDEGRPTYWVLVCSASGATIHAERYQHQLQQLRRFGYSVLAFDYRGFGRNPGVPSEAGVYTDAIGAYAFLTRELGVPPSQVILAGRSLGSAVAVELATRVRAAGLVLFSPIDSVPLTGARWYPFVPVMTLARSQFDNRSKVSRLTVPLVVVHSTHDQLVPFAVARSLYERAGGPKFMLETDGDHNRAGFASPASLQEALNRFWPAEESR